MLNVYHDNFSQGYSKQGNIESTDILDSVLSDSTVSYTENTKFYNYDVSTFSKQNKAESLSDTIDPEPNYDFCSNLIHGNISESNNNYKKKSFVASMHMEKFSLNPEAAEYNPFKQNISECSSSSQEMSNLGDSPPPLYDALFKRRQDLSSYNALNLHSPGDCHFDNIPIQSQTFDNQDSQKVEKIQSNSNEIQTESQSFINFFNDYFCNQLNEGNYEDILKSYSFLKYLLQQMNFNHSVSVQVGTSAGSEKNIIEEKELLEKQLTIALAEQAKLQHRHQVAVQNLKDIQDNQETFVNKMKDMKEKEAILMKDVQTWRKKYEALAEEKKEIEHINKIQKLELENHEKKSASYDEKVAALTQDVQYVNRNKSALSKLYEVCLKHEASSLIETKGGLIETNLKLRNYEFEILRVKKNEHKKVYNIYIAYIHDKIQELNIGISRAKSLSPQFLKVAQIFEAKLKETITNADALYAKFMNDVSSQEQMLQNGAPLSQLEQLETPSFPEIPTINSVLQCNSKNIALFPNSQLSGFSTISNNSLLSNNFEIFAQNALKCSAQEESALLYKNKNGHFNPLLEQQCFSHNQNSKQQIQTNSFLSQSHSQSHNPPVSDNLSSYSSMLPDKEISELLPSTSSIPQCLDQTENRTLIYPPGLVHQTSHSKFDTSAITQRNVSQKPNSLKSPNANVSSMCSLDDVDLPLSLSSDSERSDQSLPFPKSVLKAETASKPSAECASGTSAEIFPLELDYSGPKSISEDTAVSHLKVGCVSSSDVHTKAPKHKMNRGIAKVLNVLLSEFPDKKENELMTAIKVYREKKGPLTNLSIFTVIEDIKKTLKQVKPINTPATVDSNAQPGRPKILVNKPSTLPSTSVPSAPKTWAKINCDDDKQLNAWSAPIEKNQCSICLDQMNIKTAYKVDCGHLFHFICIKKWLTNQRNCPECRTFLLLRDDFPSL